MHIPTTIIKMNPKDEEETTFIIESAKFCYKVMPFRLKNAKAIYQHLMDKVFRGQLGWNLKVYIDDMVVKSDNLATHLANLEEVFDQLRKYNMRLNPKMCVFGVEGRMLMGFMLTH